MKTIMKTLNFLKGKYRWEEKNISEALKWRLVTRFTNDSYVGSCSDQEKKKKEGHIWNITEEKHPHLLSELETRICK